MKSLPTVIGVDCSSKRLALVNIVPGIGVPDGVEWKVIDAPKKQGWQPRLRFLADEAETFFTNVGGPCVVYVEEAPLGPGFRATLQVGYVVAAVMVEAMRAGHLVTPVNVGTWKKQTTGSGKADKDLIRGWATRLIFEPALAEDRLDPDFLPKEQDAYDAACIAAFARQNLRGTE